MIFWNDNWFIWGSPPRVREKLGNSLARTGGGRITPACAGKTVIRFQTVDTGTGSPPRVREKRGDKQANTDACRITPACAGKTLKDPIEIANTD